jgi:hypothetical protein
MIRSSFLASCNLRSAFEQDVQQMLDEINGRFIKLDPEKIKEL